MAILFVGIDLAKSVFAVHGVNDAGKPELVRPSVPRNKLLELIATLAPCTIGMEACSGAHHWARLFQAHGHTVRLMAPKFVASYRLSGKRGKNDAADAQAICEAEPGVIGIPIIPAGEFCVALDTHPGRAPGGAVPPSGHPMPPPATCADAQAS